MMILKIHTVTCSYHQRDPENTRSQLIFCRSWLVYHECSSFLAHYLMPYSNELLQNEIRWQMSFVFSIFDWCDSFRELPGHSWLAAQWAPRKDGQLNFAIGDKPDMNDWILLMKKTD